MKRSELAFMDATTGMRAEMASRNGAKIKALDWDSAAKFIKTAFKAHPDLRVEAGLQNDWEYTGGVIFEDGKPTNESYTYLASNWAIPTLILEWDGVEQEEIECYIEENDRFSSGSEWDDISLNILGIKP